MTSKCIGLPQLLASLDVKKRQAEENYREKQHRQILHRISRNSMNRRPMAPRRQMPAAKPQPGLWLCPGRGSRSKIILAHTKYEYRKSFLNKA
jgi:hypothetical protein